MARDFLKTIATANITTGYELNADEMIAIFRCHERSGDLFKVIGWAFEYGYVLGHRATVKGTYKERGKKETMERLKELESIASEYGLFEPMEKAEKKVI